MSNLPSAWLRPPVLMAPRRRLAALVACLAVVPLCFVPSLPKRWNSTSRLYRRAEPEGQASDIPGDAGAETDRAWWNDPSTASLVEKLQANDPRGASLRPRNRGCGDCRQKSFAEAPNAASCRNAWDEDPHVQKDQKADCQGFVFEAPARDRAGHHPRAEPTNATAQALGAEGEVRGAEIEMLMVVSAKVQSPGAGFAAWAELSDVAEVMLRAARQRLS
eukprot:g26878.t2